MGAFLSIDKYNKLSQQVHSLASLPPEKQMEHFANLHKDVARVSPDIAAHLSVTGQRGLMFLHDKLPKPSIEFMGEDAYEPSNAQKSQWLNYHEAVNDPIGALERVKDGTLTGQHVEALAAVHPELLQHMQQRVMENMTPKNMKTVPYNTKIALSKFLNKPVSTSMLPGAVMTDQQNFAASQVQPQAPQGTPKRGQKSTLGGLSKLNVAERAATQTEDLESEPD